MAAVEHEELPLDVGLHILRELHALEPDGRVAQSSFVHDPLVEALDADVEGAAASGGLVRGDDAIDGTVGKPDVLVDPGLVRVR